MTSHLKSDAELMADAIHRTMCYRGGETPTCRADKGDGQLMIEELAKMGIFIAKAVRNA